MRTNEEIMDILDELKEVQDLSISEIARRVDMAKSAVSRYFNRTREFPLNRAREFAKAFGIDPDYLLGMDYELPTNIEFLDEVVNIPVVGSIAAGKPITAEQNIEEYLPMPKSIMPRGKLIALNISGDSMAPGIPDGSQVLIRLQQDVEDGQIAAVQLSGNTEATLKRVKRDRNVIVLLSDNTKYPPIILNEEDSVHIIGKAVKVLYDL